MSSSSIAVAHTPGPWEPINASDGCRDIGIVGDGGVVAECFHEIRTKNEFAHSECAANARLIAAAPDLLEAVRAFLDYDAADHEDGALMMIDYAEALRKGKVAIAKATGAQS